MTKVLILGAGFGGVYTAKALLRKHIPGLEIELIDENNYFVFQPLLPEVAAGTVEAGDAVAPLRQVLRGARFGEAEILHLDVERRCVTLLQGLEREWRQVTYDHLVVALGQRIDLSRYPGMQEHAFTMKDLSDAFALRNQVIRCLEQADITENSDTRRRLLTFVIIGGGLSGIETAGEVQDLIARALKFYPRLRRAEVRIMVVEFQPRILPEVAPGLADYALGELKRRGIEVITGQGVKNAARGSVELGDGRIIETETIVATIGNSPAPIVATLPFARERGRIRTAPDLRVENYANVWALGDVAWIPQEDGKPAPPTAQAAVQQAKRLAGNLEAVLAGRPTGPFQFRPKGQLASLGGRRGVAEMFGVRLTGYLAWVVWRAVYLGLMPGGATRTRVAADWLLDRFVARNIVQIAPTRPSGIRRQRFRRGDVVYRAGDPPGPLFIIAEGRFERGGDTLGRGEFFGGEFLRGDVRREAGVRAVEDGACLVLEPHELEQLSLCLDSLAPFLKAGPDAEGLRRAGAE